MGDQIVFLEKFIDSTTALPAELNRILNSIKDLDERSDDLAAQIQENVEVVLRTPSAAGGARGGGGDELATLRSQIESDQRLLIQFAEEKVQLAVQGYDLLEQHLSQADVDIVQLEAELQKMGMPTDPGGGLSVGAPEYSGGTYDDAAPLAKRTGSRLRDVPSFDSVDLAAPAEPKPRKTTITLNLSRQMSGYEAAPALGDAQAQGGEHLPAPKRPASAAPPRKAPAPSATPAATPSEGYQRNRRAAAAGVHAVAQQVADMEDEDMSPAAHLGGAAGQTPHGHPMSFFQPS